MKRNYTHWEAAAKASKHGKAITRGELRIHIPRGTYMVQYVKPLHGDPWAVYTSAGGIRVHDWTPSNADVDRVRQWRAW